MGLIAVRFRFCRAHSVEPTGRSTALGTRRGTLARNVAARGPISRGQSTLGTRINLDSIRSGRAGARLAKYSSTAAAIDAATWRCQSRRDQQARVLGVAHVAELDQHRGRLGLLENLERCRAGRIARERDRALQVRRAAAAEVGGEIGRLAPHEIDQDVLDLVGLLLRDAIRRRPGCRRRSPCRRAAGPPCWRPAPRACRRSRRARSARNSARPRCRHGWR